MNRSRRFSMLPCLLLLALPSACGRGEGPLAIALIGNDGGGTDDRAALELRAATSPGLVGLDAEGRVVPGLAERWIVTADGLSYIFRLRDPVEHGDSWAARAASPAHAVAQALRRAVAEQADTPLGRDLLPVTAIRAMAERVVEIDLAAPQPELLTLLAQPELTLFTADLADSGPRRDPQRDLQRDVQRERGKTASALHGAGPLFARHTPNRQGQSIELAVGRAESANPDSTARPLQVDVMSAEQAMARFNAGTVDVVLGGTVDSLPLATGVRLSRGNLQLDPVTGLYGLAVSRIDGLLAEAPLREALALAIDRDALVARVGIDGWQPTTRLVAPGLDDDDGSVGERWGGVPIAIRRGQAAARVAQWRKRTGRVPALTIALPDGPGSRAVLDQLQADFAAIGVTLRAPTGKAAAAPDLRLIDRVARYPRVTWFLNQLACSKVQAACNPVGDALVEQAMRKADPTLRKQLLARAEGEITAANGFIPLARPIRWVMARSIGGGIAPNPWGWHPLPPLAQGPG